MTNFVPPSVAPGAMPVANPIVALDPMSVRLTSSGAVDETALPSIMLQGEQGSGKTSAIRTLLDCGFEHVVVLALEPGIQDILGEFPTGKVSWKYINPASSSMNDLIKAYTTLQTLSNKSIKEMGHINRGSFQQFIQVMSACANFVDDRTGKSLGSVGDFPTNWAFILDGLSGLNIVVQHAVVGLKPFLELNDYMSIQNQILEFLTVLTNDSKCLFVLNAHLERETEETTGASVLTVSTIGKKLAPKLGRFFSEVILCEKYNEGGAAKFRWVTDSSQVKCKTRNLPLSKSLAPSFKLLVDNWRAKQAKGVAK